MTLCMEFIELVYATMPEEEIPAVQKFHEVSRRNQFLMKKQKEFKSVHSNLISQVHALSLDQCLAELFREEQHVTQVTLDKKDGTTRPHDVADATQTRGQDLMQARSKISQPIGPSLLIAHKERILHHARLSIF